MFGSDFIETKISNPNYYGNFNYPRKIYTIQFNIYNDENYFTGQFTVFYQFKMISLIM